MNLRRDLRDALATTPGLISAWMIATVVAAALFLLAVCGGVREYRAALKAVCVDAAPSILAAQDIKARLADLDANAANELIGTPQQGEDARKSYDADRQALAADLVKAAKNITYGDAEEVPIRSIEYGLGQFEMHIGRARLMDERNDTRRLAEYLAANAIMHDALLKSADDLDGANRRVLENTYNSQGALEISSLTGIVITVLLLLACLIALQVLLATRTRRVLNAGLLAASALVILFTLFVISSLQGSKEDMRIAKMDCFESLSTLARIRAAAMDANGAESRWLLARITGSPAVPDDPEFTAKSQLISSVGTVGSKWGTYLNIDQQIRDLEIRGRHAEAVALCVGTKPGESDWAFAQFDTALQKVIDVNQQALDATYAEGEHRLSWFEEFAAFVCIAVCVAAFLGLRPRLREYAV